MTLSSILFTFVILWDIIYANYLHYIEAQVWDSELLLKIWKESR